MKDCGLGWRNLFFCGDGQMVDIEGEKKSTMNDGINR